MDSFRPHLCPVVGKPLLYGPVKRKRNAHLASGLRHTVAKLRDEALDALAIEVLTPVRHSAPSISTLTFLGVSRARGRIGSCASACGHARVHPQGDRSDVLARVCVACFVRGESACASAASVRVRSCVCANLRARVCVVCARACVDPG